jgi:hypothetical protein
MRNNDDIEAELLAVTGRKRNRSAQDDGDHSAEDEGV